MSMTPAIGPFGVSSLLVAGTEGSYQLDLSEDVLETMIFQIGPLIIPDNPLLNSVPSQIANSFGDGGCGSNLGDFSEESFGPLGLITECEDLADFPFSEFLDINLET